MTYDDRDAVTAYVLRWHGHLMTGPEAEGMTASLFEEKVRSLHIQGEPFATEYRRLWGRVAETSAGREALAMGAEVFRRRVCDRIVRERPDALINRCPTCGAVARTPKAQQCFWCGCDWHEPAVLPE